MIRFLYMGLFICASTSATAAPCDLQEAHTVLVTSVIDGDTVTLDTGQDVRLVGIQAPKLPLGRAGFKPQPFAQEAKAKLAKLVLGKKVTLKYGTTRSDRHKRILAHMFIGNSWVQKDMIASGMARAYSFPDNRMCVEDLISAEKTARQNKKGIWQHAYYRIRTAENIEKLAQLHGTYQLVEGKVKAVSDGRGGRTYINFGTKWKTDFTLTVFNSNRRYFKKASYTLQNLEGVRVRVRGWLGFKNGPSMNVTHPEQIEIIAR